MKRHCITFAILASLGVSPAVAEEKRMPVTPAITAQKAEFVTNLVTNSAAARTIEQSGDAAAKGLLDKARGMVEQAKKEAAAGNTAAADVKLNEALAIVMAETRRLSEHDLKQDRSKEIYEQRRNSVKALMDAFERVGQEKKSGGMAAKRAKVEKSLAEADALAAQGQHEKALPLLDEAYAAVSGDVAALRDGDKLVKELKFASAEEEYHYEIDRNDSHFFLLKLTLSDKQPDPMIVTQAEKMRGEAQAIRDRAEAKAAGKDHKEAIRLLNDSTVVLIKAMRMAGAYIPG